MGTTGLGELERLALLAVLRVGEGAYAVSVRDEIERRTGRSVSRGAIYVTLDRLERKGYVTSRLGEPTAERGGKAKRVFALEGAGQEALATSLQEIVDMTDGLATTLPWLPMPT